MQPGTLMGHDSIPMETYNHVCQVKTPTIDLHKNRILPQKTWAENKWEKVRDKQEWKTCSGF